MKLETHYTVGSSVRNHFARIRDGSPL